MTRGCRVRTPRSHVLPGAAPHAVPASCGSVSCPRRVPSSQRGLTDQPSSAATPPGDNLLPFFGRHGLTITATPCQRCKGKRKQGTADRAALAWHCPGGDTLSNKNCQWSKKLPSLSCLGNSEPPSASGDLTAQQEALILNRLQD